MTDTIFAPATAAGKAALAVIRISGPRTRFVLETILGKVPVPRRATLAVLRSPDGEALDQALVLWFPSPGSFTGEDSAEFHVHGSRAVLSAVLGALGGIEGCRSALPGEFARRALYNGKLDLAAVEGLADLVEAETEGQRRQALRQVEGVLAEAVAGWREDLLGASALIEAELDFSDEGDVPSDLSGQVLPVLVRVRSQLEEARRDAERGQRLRDGITVVIAGPPNAGKSSLLNTIAKRDVAIVSPHAGTTRDAIEVRLDLGGVPVTLVDTAGLRQSDDPVEIVGITRALQRARSAEIGLWLLPVGTPEENPPDGPEWILVRTKSDVSVGPVEENALEISVVTGAGLDALLARVSALAAELVPGSDAVAVRVRHREGVLRAATMLDRAATELRTNSPQLELAAEDIRLAIRELQSLIGSVGVDDMLDRLFASFCIGK